MASLQQDPSGNFHVVFRFVGTRFKRSLKTKQVQKAEAARIRLEENIALVESGRLELPEDVDVPIFLLSDGKLNGKTTVPKSLRLGDFYTAYTESIPSDALEPTTLKTIGLHTRHIARVLGASTKLHSLKPRDLQRYITTRSKEPGKTGAVSAGTIRKEIGTFGSLWNWAVSQGYVSGSVPKLGLVYPKQTEKPPFQTWDQIERRLAVEHLDGCEATELWHSLYLDCEKIDRLLDYVKKSSLYPFLYPMCILAAHTGVRRSELCRSRTADIDLVERTAVIRERKRSRTKRTTRVVPMSQKLTDVLARWFDECESSPFTFPEDHRVDRNRKQKLEDGCVSPDEASHHLAQTLAESNWDKISGWHIFRHSFISNCATQGIDQRFIDGWVGHQTDEQRLRYRHLFPDSQLAALDSVFH